jgi:predicted metalloprotease with PDZ domain
MSEFSISYQLSPVNLSEHLFEVSLFANVAETNELTLTLPAWIPGSYMVRDFARNIINIISDEDFELNKLDKQTWTLSRKDKQSFSKCAVHYRVFAFDLSVRSAYINHEYAFFNGTSTFLNVIGHEQLPHFVQLLKTKQTQDWEIVTAMPRANSLPAAFEKIAQATAYCCENYDVLIDSPVLMGELTQAQFTVEGVTFHVVFTGRETMDLSRICADLAPICQHHINLFEESPVKEYWFMTLLCDNAFGGLEHKASTVLQYARFDLPMRGEVGPNSEGYQQFLSLCSHEFFHTWHVKRIKPKMMVSPDLSQESYSPQLWIYEGFTSLYDDLTLARTGLVSPAEYCQILGQSITRLMRNPGRHLQSIGESSFDAWTRFYKQDANSVNHIVSYYLKGSIVALALDITLRQQTNNEKCLDDVMRILWQRYGRNESGTLDKVIQEICEQDFNLNIDSFLHVAVNTVMDLPLSSMLTSIGLRLTMRSKESNLDKGGLPCERPLSRDFGAVLSDEIQGAQVKQVLASSAAADAGLQLGDVIVACNHFKASTAKLMRFLEACSIGQHIVLHVMRDDQLLELKLEAKPAQMDTCFIAIENPEIFDAWLGLNQKRIMD